MSDRLSAWSALRRVSGALVVVALFVVLTGVPLASAVSPYKSMTGSASLRGRALGEIQRTGSDEEFVFRTPGDAVYCSEGFTNRILTTFTCITPNDGFFIRFRRVLSKHPLVEKGYDSRYRGYRDTSIRMLSFGKTWASSDARMVECWSRSTGLTCKQFYGLSFWLGRFHGYRIFRQVPGYPPEISHRLFRTRIGVWCGIAASLEPADPILLCWRSRDGLQLFISHSSEAGSRAIQPAARGYMPKGFPLLSANARFTWRCQRVAASYAENCSATTGAPVFTCVNESSGLTCRNLKGHGFVVGRRTSGVF